MENNKNNLIDKKISQLIEKIASLFKIKINNKTMLLLIQIIKFVIVGGIATLIDWIVYYISYNSFNIEPLIANLISYFVATIYNYNASVKYVFEVNQNNSAKRNFIVFITFSLLGLALSEIILYITIKLLGMHSLLSKIISTVIVMTFNFVTRKKFLENK